MQGKKLKLISFPSLLAAIIFSSLTIGTTFALFTNSSETTIQVSSGTLKIAANLREYEEHSRVEDNVTYVPELLTYSAVADPDGDLVDETEQHHHYRHELQPFTTYDGEIAAYSFSNDGFATYTTNPGAINLVKMTPGDMVKFQFNVVNQSNVAMKYRFRYEVIGTNTLLAKALNTKIFEGTTTAIDAGTATTLEYDSLKTYMSPWAVFAPEVNPSSVGFEIALPITAGNIYQDKACTILITFEAVQGNATTPEGATVEYISD